MKKFKMSNEVYDILKEIALTTLPAFSVLVLTLGKIWNVPYNVEIAGTITALDLFLGACLHVSNKNYTEDKDM